MTTPCLRANFLGLRSLSLDQVEYKIHIFGLVDGAFVHFIKQRKKFEKFCVSIAVSAEKVASIRFASKLSQSQIAGFASQCSPG